MIEDNQSSRARRGFCVTELPGFVVSAPEPRPGAITLQGTYTASTGLKIPITLHTGPGGIIERLWREEYERRFPRKLTVEEDPSQLLAEGPPTPRLLNE